MISFSRLYMILVAVLFVLGFTYTSHKTFASDDNMTIATGSDDNVAIANGFEQDNSDRVKAFASSGVNLINEPGFESGGTNWTNSSNAGRAVVGTEFNTGLSSLEIILSSAQWRAVVQNISTTAGTIYDVSGWVKADGVDNNKAST